MKNYVVSPRNFSKQTKRIICTKFVHLANTAAQIPETMLSSLFADVDSLSFLCNDNRIISVCSSVKRFYAGESCAHIMTLYSDDTYGWYPIGLVNTVGSLIQAISEKHYPRFVAYRTNNANTLNLGRLLGPRRVPTEPNCFSQELINVKEYIQEYYPNCSFDYDKCCFRQDYGMDYQRGRIRPSPEADLLESIGSDDGRSLLLVVHSFRPAKAYKRRFVNNVEAIWIDAEKDFLHLLESVPAN